MKRIVLMNLCLLLAAVAIGSGTRQDIGLCSFFFPGQPQLSDQGDLRNYSYVTDSCTYIAQVKVNIRHDMVHDSATLAQFYGGVVRGILRASHGTQLGHKALPIAGLPGEQLEYVKGNENHQPVSVMSRILLLDNQLVIFSFFAPYERYTSQKDSRERFLASIELDKGKKVDQYSTAADTVVPVSANTISGTASAPVPPANTVSTELVKPNTLNFMVSFVVCVLVLATLLYVAVRWRKRRADKQ